MHPDPDWSHALRAGDATAVAALLAAEPSRRDAWLHDRVVEGETCLCAAIPEYGQVAYAGHEATVALLLSAGTAVDSRSNPPNNDGGTALIYAAWSDQPWAVEALLAAGADPAARTRSGETALDTAARHGCRGSVGVLLAHGVTATPGQLVAAGLIERVADLLASQPSVIDWRDAEGGTLLHVAVSCESRTETAILEALRAAGVPLDALDARGRTALCVALEGDKPEAAAWLGQRYLARSVWDRVALGEPLQVQERWTAEAQPDGMTLAFYAARFGRSELLAQLLGQGADANSVCDRWWMERTPLHSAAMRGHSDVVSLLLAHGADPLAVNEHGYTPLHVAQRWRHADVVALLEHSHHPRP